MRPLRAKYIGYTRGTENHGDETLLWLIRDLLAPEIEIVCEAESFDLALLGGGTLINQSPWLIDAFGQALDHAGRGLVFGSGVGDTPFWGDHFDRWIPLLRRCGPVGVRGPHSVALLRDHGFDGAACIGDPYLWIENPVPRQTIPRLLGVNLGSTNDSLWGTDDRALFDFTAEALGILRDRGWRFVWVSVWSRDLAPLNTVRQRVDHGEGPLLDARSQPLEALSAISACHVFLGEKLHANAMAAVTGVPFVSLEYQPKVRDFAASLDVEDWVISTAVRETEALTGLIESLRDRRAEVVSRMVSARDSLRARMRSFVAEVKRHFASQAVP
jgi:hypothetical protein